MNSLISKYNIPVPRYTSYPTVPFWDDAPTEGKWKELVKDAFHLSNTKDGISIYIHLPFCESLCTFCACNTRITVNHAVEEPYIKAVLKEWNMYREVFGGKPRIKEIHLGGGTPTFFAPANLKKLVEGILENTEICEDHEFSFEAHPANTFPSHLITLYQLGFRRISFGIQDFSYKVQEAIHRFQTFEEVDVICKQARNVGFTSVNFDLVYGLPFQTLESISDTIKKSLLIKPDRIAFYSYAHVPWIKPGQRKFTEKDLPLDEVKRNLYEEGKKLFIENGYVEIGMDHFSLPGDTLYKAVQSKRLHRNFMGYTHNFTSLLIGLGVSAISDTWTGFAQNLKSVEGYQQAIEENKLPVFKGHVLTREDLVIRQHILNLMCRFETAWADDSLKYDALYNVLPRLKEFEKDGLVIIEPFMIKVTENGKAFIRNICMCFDERYWQKTPGVKIFSSAV